MNNINICISCDNNYIKHAGVVIASILDNSLKSEILNFYILGLDLSSENKTKILSLKQIRSCNIYFIEPDINTFSEFESLKTHAYITLPAYFRLKLPTILPNIERVIYLDCDTVVNTNLGELYNTNLEGKPLAGVIDINKRKQKKLPGYINSGVLVLDLNKMETKK